MADFEVKENINLGGNKIKNGGFEVVTSLPTTFKGTQITYDNKVWTWDEVNSKYVCNESWIRLDPHDYIDNAHKFRIYKIIDIDPDISYGYLSLTIQIKGDYNYDHEGEWRLSISKFTSTKITTYLREISPRRYVSLNIYVTSDGVYLQALRTQWQCQVDIRIYNRYSYTDNALSLNSILPYSYDIPTDSFLLENTGSVSYSISSETFSVNGNPVFDNIDINQTINFNTNNIEPTQTGTVTKTSTWLWQYLTQSVNFLWLKLKDLFPTTQSDTYNYLPKIDNANKKLVKSNLQDDGSTLTYEGNLDLKGNSIKNGGFEVFDVLPTTFKGTQITFGGKVWTWDVTEGKYKCDSDYLEIGGRNLISSLPINWQQGSFAGGSLAIINSYKSRILITDIEVSPSTQYTINLKDGYEVWIPQLDENKIGVLNTTANFISPTTFITTANTRYLYLSLRKTGTNYDSTNPDDFISPSDIADVNIKLEKGNIATDWTPAPEDKANENQTLNYDTITEPTETGTKTKTSTTLWQNLFAHINFLWLKLKDLFPTTQATTNNYIPKIDNSLKKLVKSNINDDGTTPKYGANTIWHSGNDGSSSGLDADLLDGYHANSFVTTNEIQSISGVKIFGSDYITLNNEPLSNYAMGLRIPVRSALIHSFSINYLFNADLKSNITINAPNTNTYSGNPASLFNGDVYSENGFRLLVDNISPSNPFVLEVSSNSVLLPYIERASKFIFTEATGWTNNYGTSKAAFLNWKLEIQGNNDGLWYPLINRSGVEDKVNNLTIIGFPSNTLFATNGNRQGLAFRLTVYEASPYGISYPYIFLSQILYFNYQSSAGGNLITERGGTILGDLIVNKTVQSNENINFNTNNIEPTQSGTTTKTSTWLWQYLVQTVNFLWLKLKTWVGGLFSAGSATTNNNYLPKIDDANKKLVKSNIQDDGTTPKYGSNTIWHSGNSNFENSSISLSSGTDLNTLTSGKYHTSNSAIIASLLNCPVNTGELNLIVYNSGSNSYVFQELYSITQKTVYQRTNNGGTWSVWQKVWHSGNDGSGSGLDADTLDSKHASDFALSNHNHDYNLLDNLPNIYNAKHDEVPTDDFNLLWEYSNNIWGCRTSMKNAPKSDEGSLDEDYKMDFSKCLVQQFGEGSEGVQILYITTSYVEHLTKGNIFYRVDTGLWHRLTTYNDISIILNTISTIETTVDSKLNKMTKETLTLPPNNSINNVFEVTPTANKLIEVNPEHATQLMYVYIKHFNSLEECTIHLNPSKTGELWNITYSNDYKTAGFVPVLSGQESWYITIWNGTLFFNKIN